MNKAQTHFNAGEIRDAWRKLKEGFNVESIKKYYDPNYMKKLEKKKKKQEKRKKEIEEGKAKEDIKDNLEEPEDQRKMREEKFEIPKLRPVLEEAYNLIIALEAYDQKEVQEKQKAHKTIMKKLLKQKKDNKVEQEESKKRLQEKRK